MAQRIEIDDALLDRARDQCPKYLSTTGFINLMLDQALTGVVKLPAYCVGAGTWEPQAVPTRSLQYLPTQQDEIPAAMAGACLQEEENLEPLKKGGVGGKKSVDPFSKRVITEDLVPAEISDCAALIVEFWAVKKGVRSERVWNRICDKLRGWVPKERKEALERSISNGWGDVFDPPVPRFTRPNQPPEPPRHPAAREFRNGKFVDEEPVTNPVLAGLL